MIKALDPNLESDFQPFGDSGSGFRSNKKWNHNTSTTHCSKYNGRSHHSCTVRDKVLPYSVKFEVESAGVADWLALVVPPPERRGGRAAVGALQARSPVPRLQ